MSRRSRTSYPDRRTAAGRADRPDRRGPDHRRRRGRRPRTAPTAALDVHARERMQEARDVIESLVAEGAVVYGVTTGFGALASTFIPPGRRRPAPGEPADEPRGRRRGGRSRARSSGRCCCCGPTRSRSATAAAGRCSSTGCSTSSRAGHPPGRARSRGASGASGDLAPLAHLALPLIGRGQVEVGGSVVPAIDRAARGRPRAADARGQGGPRAAQRDPDDERDRGARSWPTPTGSCGRPASPRRCRVEALLGTDVAFAAAYQLARPHPGQVAVAAELRHLLRDSGAPDRPPRPRPQGPGPVLAALRAAGPRRGARRARPPPARPRHRAQLGDRQPARLPGRRRRRRRHDRDRRRPGHQRRQLPRRADRARARLRQDRPGRARVDQRAADGAARRSAAQRRAAAVPGGRVRASTPG